MADNIEKSKELTEKEISEVNGGAANGWVFPNEDGPEYDHLFKFKVGEHVEYITGVLPFNLYEFTEGGTVRHRSHDWYGTSVYQISGLDSRSESDWIYANRIQGGLLS